MALLAEWGGSPFPERDGMVNRRLECLQNATLTYSVRLKRRPGGEDETDWTGMAVAMGKSKSTYATTHLAFKAIRTKKQDRIL